LDRVMDGNDERVCCEARSVEISCDLCRASRPEDTEASEEDVDEGGFGFGGTEDEELDTDDERGDAVDDETGDETSDDTDDVDQAIGKAVNRTDDIEMVEQTIRANLDRSRRRAAVWRQRSREQRMTEGRESERLRDLLLLFRKRCVLCEFLRDDGGEGEEVRGHDEEDCPMDDVEVLEGAKKYKAILQRLWGERMLARFSGCFGCGLPQNICDGWVEVEAGEGEDGEDGRRRFQRTGLACQYGGVLVRAMAEWHVVNERLDISRPRLGDMVEEMMGEGGLAFDGIEEDGWLKWLGNKVRMAELETNNLCRVFVRFMYG
jgi:hypothetical protein